jgi:hypothetical protein
MTLFQPSTKAVSAAAQEIADCVGASGDSEMTTRAGRSLFAALEHFNNRAKWNFLLTEASPISIIAPFNVTGVSASAGQASAACPAGHGLQPDDFISLTGLTDGIRVSATAASGFGIYGSFALGAGVQVGTATATRDMYDLPSDWKAPYTVRMVVSKTTLHPVGRRFYDRFNMLSEQSSLTVPTNYDVFMIGSRGKIRILQPPSSPDVLQLRYYRRMTIPTTTATASVLDIHQDYEPYLMAWGKWHFLTDKSEGRGDQLKTWFALSEQGLTTMLKEQTNQPDQDVGFIPGAYVFGVWGDNTTRFINWDQS